MAALDWFANDVAVGEIARVLRAGGVLALMWNQSDDPSPLPVCGALRGQPCRDYLRSGTGG